MAGPGPDCGGSGRVVPRARTRRRSFLRADGRVDPGRRGAVRAARRDAARARNGGGARARVLSFADHGAARPEPRHPRGRPADRAVAAADPARHDHWSHDLLDGEERVLFRRLAVFAGSFSLEAAEDTAPAARSRGGGRRRCSCASSRSRLQSSRTPSSPVIASLDTVRQFADEQLVAAGEREAVETRLRDWALALTADPPPLAQLELDHDNLRAALDSGLRRDPQGALRLAANVWRFWLDRNYFTEGARRLHAVLGAAPEATELRAQDTVAAAALEQRCGRPAALHGVWPARRSHSPAACARSCGRRTPRVRVTRDGGSDPRRLPRCLCRGASTSRDDEPVRASILNVMALIPYYLGDLAESQACLEASLDAPPRNEACATSVLRGGEPRPRDPAGRPGRPAAPDPRRDDLPFSPARSRPRDSTRALQSRTAGTRRRRPRRR